MHFLVYSRHNEDGTPPEDAERVEVIDIGPTIDNLSGRPGVGRYILLTAIPSARRRNGRASAYVATAKGSPWRERGEGPGFIVRQMDA